MLTEPQRRWLATHEAGATRLAALVSLAALADPGLVRAARIALALPVGAELDLRCSPIVSSGSQAGLVLAEEALPVLRARLDAPGLDLAWQLTRARHDALSPALVLEETLTWESLAGSQEASPASGPSAETRLNRALVAIVRGKQTQLAGWAARALPRLPVELRELPSARLLASAAQANGYRTSPSLGLDGPPPAWMLPQTPGSAQVQGSVALFGTTLEISYPGRSGEQTLPLPENRRIWVSWWQARERVWTERTVARNRTLVLEVEGAEIAIEAPGFGRVVIEDQGAPWAEIATFGSVDRNGLELQQALRDRLAAHGVRVVIAQETVASRASSPNYLLVMTGPEPAGNMRGAQMSAQRHWVSKSLAQCRPVIVLEAPGSQPLLSELADEGLATFDCRDRSRWDEQIGEVVSQVLAGPPALTETTGAPAQPAAFVRRQELFAKMKTAVQRATRSAPLVNLWGPEGSGRNMAAADLVRDCAVQRRFPNGIFWIGGDDAWHRGRRLSWDPITSTAVPHATPSWWHEEMQPPFLIVLEDMSAEKLDVDRLAEQLTEVDGRCLFLTRERVSDVPAISNQGKIPISSKISTEQRLSTVPAIDATVWQPSELLALFRRSVSAQENESEIESAFSLVPEAAHELKGTFYIHRIMPARNVANLGRLAGMTVRSGEKPESAFDLFANKQLLESLFELDMVEPFAACPAGWKFAEPNDPIWRRYFKPDRHAQILKAHTLVTQAFPDSDGTQIAPWASRALVELALPTHGRIVESYREECGGDWAIYADDGYYLKFFAWHLQHAGDIAELTENIDWIIRATRDAAGWHELLPQSLGFYSLNWVFVDPVSHEVSLENLARYSSSSVSSSAGASIDLHKGRSMAEARLAILRDQPVRWILVIGSRIGQLDPMLAMLSECVGRELARWGYGLLTDGVRGVVAKVEQAYTAQLSTNGFPPGTGVRDADRYANYTEDGPVPWEENGESEALAQNADAVVVIGGDKKMSTMQGILESLVPIGLAKRPIPIGGSGGIAAEMAAEMTDMPKSDAWATLNKKPESRADCYAMAKALITLLPENPSQTESGVGG